VSASSRSGEVLGHRTPAQAAATLQSDSAGGMSPPQAARLVPPPQAARLVLRQRAGRVTVKTSWLAWVASEPMPVTVSPFGASALIW
jgi:hypothetical protein